MIDPHIAELLGIDPDAPETRRELQAVERDARLIETLVRLRRARGLTQAQVAERMNRSQPAVSDFERLGGDPHLSTVRRYALAIGVDITHTVHVPDAPPAETAAGGVARIHLDATRGEGNGDGDGDSGDGATALGDVTAGVVSLELVRVDV